MEVKEPEHVTFNTPEEHLSAFENLKENKGWKFLARHFWAKANYLKDQASSYPIRESNREAVNEKISEARAYLNVLSMVEADVTRIKKELGLEKNNGS